MLSTDAWIRSLVRGVWCFASTSTSSSTDADSRLRSDTRSSDSQLEIVSGADARGRVSESEAKSEESEESEQGEKGEDRELRRPRGG